MKAFNYYRRRYPVDCVDIFSLFDIDTLEVLKRNGFKPARITKDLYFVNGIRIYKKGEICFVNNIAWKDGYNQTIFLKAKVKTDSGYHSFIVDRDEYRFLPIMTINDWKDYGACDV